MQTSSNTSWEPLYGSPLSCEVPLPRRGRGSWDFRVLSSVAAIPLDGELCGTRTIRHRGHGAILGATGLEQRRGAVLVLGHVVLDGNGLVGGLVLNDPLRGGLVLRRLTGRVVELLARFPVVDVVVQVARVRGIGIVSGLGFGLGVEVVAVVGIGLGTGRALSSSGCATVPDFRAWEITGRL